MPVPETTRALSPRARRLDRTAIQDDVGGRSVAPAIPRPNSTATRQAAVLGLLAVLTLITAIGAALAPVVADDPVVRWPQAGQPPRSTVLPLVPYRPLRLEAGVPCTALSALDQRPGGGDALRTLPVTAGKEGRVSQGLVVRPDAAAGAAACWSVHVPGAGRRRRGAGAPARPGCGCPAGTGCGCPARSRQAC
ncbi:MAG: hypothetical protein LC721_12500 [Actinobacteria bacterium]|nr:hypothetical protein [Actinomycetota bacterium]